MGEFTAMDGCCWGLQAVVGGDDNGFSTVLAQNQDFCFDSFGIQGYDLDDLDGFLTIPDDTALRTTSTVTVDELEELYKPFYPMFHTDLSQQAVVAPPFISVPEQAVEKEPEVEVSPPSPDVSSSDANATIAHHASKYKKRKNQCKRVVLKATTEGLSSDKWAWRKYGQKPIKGSPYPRSYYRCSSSKGCPARKHVEQSGEDPVTFILTYSGEHNHTEPTRRNSLAGTTRQRFTNPKKLRGCDPHATEANESSTSSSISNSAVNPATSLMGTSEEDSPQRMINQPIRNVHEEQMLEVREYDGVAVSSLKFNDYLFDNLNDLDGMTSDLVFDSSFYQQISDDFM